MIKPLVSVIIPVYNAADSIGGTIEVLINQNFRDFELILVDDGSIDDSLKIMEKIAKQDQRVKVISQVNGGPSAARNTGLKHTNGQFIQFYDADDIIFPDALQIVTQTIIDDVSNLVVSGWQIDIQTEGRVIENYKQITPKKQLIDHDIKKHILRSIGQDGLFYNLWNKLFVAEIIQKHNLRFREDVHFGEDLIFSLEYFGYIQKISIIPDVTYGYLTNSKTSVVRSSSIVPEFVAANIKALEEFVGENLDEETEDLLNWVKLRWLGTYWRSVIGSDIDNETKSNLLKNSPKTTLRLIKSSKFIGIGRFFISWVLYISQNRPWLMKISAKGFISLKNTITSLKSIRK